MAVREARTDPVPAVAVGILGVSWQRIAEPSAWLPGPVVAETAEGVPCAPEHAEAVRWCALGSLQATWGMLAGWSAGEAAWGRASDVLAQAAGELYATSVPDVNDALGHDAVRRVYERAMTLVEGEGS